MGTSRDIDLARRPGPGWELEAGEALRKRDEALGSRKRDGELGSCKRDRAARLVWTALGWVSLALGLIGLLLDGLMRMLEGLKTVRWRYAR